MKIIVTVMLAIALSAVQARAGNIGDTIYEWKSTLCKLGVTACELPPGRPPNRLWDNGGYAPPPGRS
jgi:hypothetical protein